MSLSKRTHIILAVVFCSIVFCFSDRTQAIDINQPFLYLPFSYKNFHIFSISEGRRYTGIVGDLAKIGSGETAIHGLKNHSAIDYSLPYGTAVFAPIDGYVIASYHNEMLKSKGYVKQYQGVGLHYGLGWYVQIWNPEQNVFIRLAHLSSIDSHIPVSEPYPTYYKGSVARRDSTHMTIDADLLQKMINSDTVYPRLVYVKRGQRIGTVGVSGLERDDHMVQSAPIPRVPMDEPLTRDDPHIHMEVFTIRENKKILLDPYAIYADAFSYPDGNTVRTSLGANYFIHSATGRIRFADEK